MTNMNFYDKLTLCSFSIIGLIFLAMILTEFFKKKKINSLENQVFKSMIFVNIILSFLEITSIILATNTTNYGLIKATNKIYVGFLVSWLFIMNHYTFITSSTKFIPNVPYSQNPNKKYFAKVRKTYWIIMAIVILIVIFTPIKLVPNAPWNATGMCVYVAYSVFQIAIIFIVAVFIKNRKTVKKRQVLPFVTLIICMFASLITDYLFTDVLITSATICLITTFIYLVLENPDLKLIEELNMAKRTATKASSAKTEFVSNMSNEIKTPLNAIVGFALALKDENIPTQAMAEVDEIIESSNNLLEIVNDILDISLIEANKLELMNHEYNIKQLLTDMADIATASCEAKHLNPKINIDPLIPEVLIGDQVRVKQILINLLSNAIKFTKEGSVTFNVTSTINDDKCTLSIYIEDSGIGIESDQLETIFKNFHRVDNDNNVTDLGTGLGLSITKHLVEMMNGNIRIDSEYGKGTKVVANIIQTIGAKDASEVESNLVNKIVYFDASNKKVAIVDDNAVNLKVARRLVKEYNIEPELFLSGDELIESIRGGNKYDLIFLDEMMPKKTGTETLKELKETEYFHTKVVALTANQTEGVKINYLAAGFNNYLAKPIIKEELFIIMNQYLNDGQTNKIDKI